MNTYTRGLVLGLVTGFLLGAMVGTVALSRAQWGSDSYAEIGRERDRAQQQLLNQQLQMDLYQRQSQGMQRDFTVPMPPVLNPC